MSARGGQSTRAGHARLRPARGRARVALLLVSAVVAVLALPAVPATAAPSSRPSRRVLSGTVVDVAGRPVAGATVELRQRAGGDALGQALMCLFSFFLAPLVCDWRVETARTDRAGRYAFRLRADDRLVQDGHRSLKVIGAKPASGLDPGTFSGEFVVTRTTRTLPPVVLWTKPGTLSREQGRTRFAVTHPRGSSGTMQWRLRSTDSRHAAWTVALRQDESSVSVDDRVLETGTRSADGTVQGRWAGQPATWWSAGLAVPTVGIPASRRLACGTYDADGSELRFPSCPWTDGRLSVTPGLAGLLTLEKGRQECRTSSECARPGSLLLDLGGLRWLDAVVWRGCSSCALELSADGTTWFDWPAQRTEGSADAVVTGAPVPSRYVRLYGDVFTLWELREISVWSAPLTQPPVTPGAGLPATAHVGRYISGIGDASWKKLPSGSASVASHISPPAGPGW